MNTGSLVARNVDSAIDEACAEARFCMLMLARGCERLLLLVSVQLFSLKTIYLLSSSLEETEKEDGGCRPFKQDYDK